MTASFHAHKHRGKWDTFLEIDLGKHKTKKVVNSIAEGLGLRRRINGKSIMIFQGQSTEE